MSLAHESPMQACVLRAFLAVLRREEQCGQDLMWPVDPCAAVLLTVDDLDNLRQLY